MIKKFNFVLCICIFLLACSLFMIGCDEVESDIYADNGLEYVVNSDGVTCTIVGIGKCTDTVVTVPEFIKEYRVSAIGDEAFCAGKYQICADIIEIILPEGLKTIGNSSFEICDKLAKINIPSTVTDIGEKAFERCTSLKCLSLPEGIREIKAHTFMGCTSLVSFTVPESVEIIGASAFLGCTSLESITLPDALKEIGESAFHLSGIRSVGIGSGVSTIGMMAFMQCENLTDVYYRGTLAELKSITTNGGWIDGKETVHCSDTDISASDLYN